MWPGMRPATGWIANFTSTPSWSSVVHQLAHRVLGLRDRHAVAGHDDHRARVLHDERGILGAARLDHLVAGVGQRRRRVSPKPPRITLTNERFIARHMM